MYPYNFFFFRNFCDGYTIFEVCNSRFVTYVVSVYVPHTIVFGFIRRYLATPVQPLSLNSFTTFKICQVLAALCTTGVLNVVQKFFSVGLSIPNALKKAICLVFGIFH